MRVRIIKYIETIKGNLEPGKIVFVKPFIAREWIEKGWAIEDKSLDGASEIK